MAQVEEPLANGSSKHVCTLANPYLVRRGFGTHTRSTIHDLAAVRHRVGG
jgi:hypothetical protein